MDKYEIIEQLKIIRDKKEKAITTQSYEMASQLLDREKDLLKQLEEIEQNDQKHSR